jgi:hypothetical protein
MNAPQSHSAKACIYCATACSGMRKDMCGSAMCAAAFAAQAKVDVGQRKSRSSEDVFRELSALAFLGLAFIAPLLFG